MLTLGVLIEKGTKLLYNQIYLRDVENYKDHVWARMFITLLTRKLIQYISHFLLYLQYDKVGLFLIKTIFSVLLKLYS